MWNSLTALAALTLAVALSGCASLQAVDAEVSSYGQWAAQRAPAAYVFERLPSQQSRPEQQEALEAAAGPALAAAGFMPAAAGESAVYGVQLGWRVTQLLPARDPFYGGRGSVFAGMGGHGRGGVGLGVGLNLSPPVYNREVVLLLRERASGQTLYESRAASNGYAEGFDGLLPALFEAALKDFPNAGVNPRTVRVELPPR